MTLPVRAWGVVLVGLCGCVGPLRADDAAPLPRSLPAPAPVSASKFTIVELPPPAGPFAGAPRRAHHALSFRAEAPKRWLNAIGVDATDCATRIRFPSRITRSADGGAQAELAAQMQFSCRF